MGAEFLGRGTDWWNGALIFSLVLAAIAAALVGITTRTVVRLQKVEATAAAERVAALELKAEQLRKQLGPRQLQREIFLREIAEAQPGNVEIMYLRDDPECFDLAQQIWRVLEAARWNVVPPTPIPSKDRSFGPTAMGVDGQPSGVTVVTHRVSVDEANASENQMLGRPWVRTPWTVLMKALGDSLGRINGSGGGSNAPADGMLRIVVAPR